METVHIKISAQIEGRFLALPAPIEVQIGTAELYGYKATECSMPTVLDALIQLHIQLFSETTPEGLKDYLVVSPSGTIRMMFGIPTESVGFSINGMLPNDGQISPLYGEYTGYFASRAELKDGDDVKFFFFADSFYSDNESWYENNGARPHSIAAKRGEEVALKLMGYCFMYYGASPELSEKIAPIGYAQAGVISAEGEIELLSGALTDTQGNIAISFDKPGTYHVSAVPYEDFRYIVRPHITVNVT